MFIVYNIKYLTIHFLVSVSLLGQFIGTLITISPLVALLNNQLSLYLTSLQQNIKVLNLEKYQIIKKSKPDKPHPLNARVHKCSILSPKAPRREVKDLERPSLSSSWAWANFHPWSSPDEVWSSKYLDLTIRDGAANAAWCGCIQTSQKYGPELPPICAVFWPSLTHTADLVNFNASNWPFQMSINIFLNTNNSFISVSAK